MPRALCLHCGDHPAALPAALCRACIAQARRDLAALPDWHEALLSRPIGAPTQRVSTTHEGPTPISEAAMDARAAIRQGLVSWALLVMEESQTTRRAPEDSVPAVAAWLAQDDVDAWLLAHPAVGDWCIELDQLVERSQRIAAPGRRDTVPIGKCPSCAGMVIADPHTLDAWCVTCRDAGDLSWWRSRLPEAGEWMSSRQLRTHLLVADGVTVTEVQLRQWAHRGHVATATDGTQVIYRVSDARTRARTAAGSYPVTQLA